MQAAARQCQVPPGPTAFSLMDRWQRLNITVDGLQRVFRLLAGLRSLAEC
tara:strand:+ start:6038 stop:6187 length:150 start_codon:yes stop_codon:yes gene_type:complete